MQAPNWTDFLQCSICTNKFDRSEVLPISLTCGHTLCMRCLGKTRICPYDKVAIRADVESFPANAALLQVLGHKVDTTALDNSSQVEKLDEADRSRYSLAVSAILELSLFLQPLAEHGISAAITYLTKPMLKKLVTVINCQVLESEGQVRAMRAARSIADRTVTELLVMHQNQQQISTLLWTAVRNRGCQFLGPVMQEEALKLILRVLESGNSLSRKNIVLFVVQRLSNDFPQASKTSVGHVVQLLYRASCFNVEKRDDDSSLMQLKEEFRSYECLRREHDGQIIRMAMEAGLRISPEQWSTLLYGDHKHKSDMQSIIDKLISQGAASSGMSELIVAVGRSQDPYQLAEKVVPHLETIFKVSIGPDKNSETVEWESFASVMQALLATLHGFSTFMQIQNGRFKTGMCPHLSKPGGCPKGERCTYAHSEEERDRFRSMVKPAKPVRSRTAEQFRSSGGKSRSGDHGPVKAHNTDLSLGNFDLLQAGHSSLPEQHFSELIRYSGEQLQGLRCSGRPAPMTAPVLTTQEWHRGSMAAMDNGLSSYKSLSPYASVNQAVVNQAVVNQVAVNQAAINQALSNMRLQHEAVNQSIEASAYSRLPPNPAIDTYPRELLPATTPASYPRELLPATTPAYMEYPQRPELVPYQLTPDSLQDGMMTQQLLSGMENLELSRAPSNSLHSNSSSSDGYTPATSSSPAVQVVSPETPSVTITTSAASVACSGESGLDTTATTTTSSSQNEMAVEIERLREKLRLQGQLIEQQQQQQQLQQQHQQQQQLQQQQQQQQQQHAVNVQQLHYGEGMSKAVSQQSPAMTQYSASAQYPSTAQYPNPQYSAVQQPLSGNPQYSALYNNMMGDTQLASHAYPGYSTKQLQAAAIAAALVGSQQTNSGGGAYYPTATLAATPSYQTHWSGPQPSISPYPHGTTTTPNPGIIMSAPLPMLPSAPQPLDSDDAMLATYIQMMEQSKASAPTYQATSTYNPQYYYQH